MSFNIRRSLQLARKNPQALLSKCIGKIDTLDTNSRRSLIASIKPTEAIFAEYEAISNKGSEKPLLGVPTLVQDLIDIPDLPTLCGAPFSEPFDVNIDIDSEFSSLLKELGLVAVGKNVPSEFGVGLLGRNATYGDCTHPKNPELALGGGAGATVKCVVDGMVPVVFGMDSCGGVRVPCAYQGAYGFRMGLGMLTNSTSFPLIPSLESVAWANNSAEDLLATFKAFYPSLPACKPTKGLCLLEGIDLVPEIIQATNTIAHRLSATHNYTQQTKLDRAFRNAGRALKLVQARELYSIHKYWLEEYLSKYSPNLLKSIFNGMECSTSEVEKLWQRKERIRNAIGELFESYDFLIMPISSKPTPLKTSWNADIEGSLMQLLAPISLARLPALVVPFDTGNGTSSAVQIAINPKKLGIVPSLIEALSTPDN